MIFPGLPDSARVWIFASRHPIDTRIGEELLADVQGFIESWASHGRPVPGAASLEGDRLLIVAAYLGEGANAGVSGCGIDALVHSVDEAASRRDIAWLDGLDVLYRDASGVTQSVDRQTFRALARRGEVTPQTIVFDTTVADLGTLRERGIEVPAEEAWHARVFRLATPA